MSTMNYRIAQLDLARQMETPEFIREFIDMLSAGGYNMLLLYLEDRIITPSYQLPSPDEAYTCDQIRELVAYGAKKGVELFPCIATLGHAERFLKHPELADIAELRGGQKGRFGTERKQTFCVSKPEFYDFLFRYIREVTELFPSKFFHVGLDEFWDFNLCPLCRAQAPDLAGEGRLFLRHLLKVHDFLKSLGKRMVMWSDMFEHYRDILEEVPRDVVMADWQYQSDVRFGQGHFDNLSVSDNLGRYQKLGFEVFIAPHDMKITNALSFFRYAAPYDCVTGAIITGWEKTDTYWWRYFPCFAAAGYLMQGKTEEEAFRACARQLFGLEDPQFIQVLRTAISSEFIRHFASSDDSVLFSRSHFGFDGENDQFLKLVVQELKRWIPQVVRGGDILQDMLELYEERILSADLKKASLNALDFGLTPDGRREITELHRRYLEHFEMRAREWKKWRDGIVPNFFETKIPMLRERMAAHLAKLDGGTFLKLRLMHGDWYGMPRLSVQLKVHGIWQEVIKDRVLKPDHLTIQLAEFFMAVPREFLEAEAVRFENTGFGGVGIAFAELVCCGRSVAVPAEVVEVRNDVLNPENVLSNNSCWSFFGNQNMRETYCHPEMFAVRNSLELSLKKIISEKGV